MYCVGWPPVPALYNAPVFAASAVNAMAAQSVSIDKYPKGEHQVGEVGGDIHSGTTGLHPPPDDVQDFRVRILFPSVRKHFTHVTREHRA